ncbi:phage holin family protein [Oceanicola sp. 502str15]|uniref:phage holin family protein n=1 Tax=Oceanicola sp. 502str15 TaxID=2696061 RepID=UPI002095637C|nr:phage holin family protein [Oceanicola sp. 502str15]MCO6381832.1 hypothetical protein [Oceanicola sp. 502str15]
MLQALKLSLAQGLRRAGFSLGAGLCFLVGAAFLTVAGWIFLVETTSTQTAALIVGAIWFALGFILLGLSRVRPASHHAATHHTAKPAHGPAKADPFGLAQAFLFGMQAGQNTGRRS